MFLLPMNTPGSKKARDKLRVMQSVESQSIVAAPRGTGPVPEVLPDLPAWRAENSVVSRGSLKHGLSAS